MHINSMWIIIDTDSCASTWWATHNPRYYMLNVNFNNKYKQQIGKQKYLQNNNTTGKLHITWRWSQPKKHYYHYTNDHKAP